MDKIKVIIADDSDFVRDGMKIILDVDDDFEVIGCASNGREAIELAERNKPDVFLMDIQMPVMDGIAATQEIRKIEKAERRQRLPIIAVTARAMFGDKERIIENQLDDYIAKPYNLNVVVDTLNKYIRK